MKSKIYNVGVISLNTNDFLYWKEKNGLKGEGLDNKRKFKVGNSVYFCLTSIGDTCSLELNEVIETEKAKLNKEYEEIISIIQHDREIAVKKDSSIKVTIKKDSEAAKEFESLKELKQKYKEMVESGELSRLQKIYQMAEEAWEGCDGCDGDDKVFWMNGFRAGYYRATPDEISDEEIDKEAFKYVYENKISDIHVVSFIAGAKWYKEQLKKD